MIFTLHRYIFKDLLRTFIIATAVLSTMLSLGIMLRPLREYSVDPARVPELLFCTLPMTLTMVMPIAALLAATLSYGRLAVENEINACRSSGIGLATLVYPGLTLALLVGVTCLLLVFHVIPSYTKNFEEIIAEDTESIIYRNIEKKGNLGRILPRVMLYADQADEANHRLLGVVAVRYSQDGIEQIVTAREVIVRMTKNEDMNRIMLRFQDAAVVEDLAEYTQKEAIIWVNTPSLWQDNVKFKKLTDLQAIRQDMSLFKPVRARLEDFRRQLAAEWCLGYYDQRLRREGFIDLQRYRQRLQVKAEGLKVKEFKIKENQFGMTSWSRSAELLGSGAWPVSVTLFRANEPQQADKHYLAKRGQLRIDLDQEQTQMVLTLEQVQWKYADQPAEQANVHYLERYSFPLLEAVQTNLEAIQQLSLEQVRGGHDAGMGLVTPSATLKKLFNLLRQECEEVHIEILMELHSRLAFGVSCVALVLLGVALGIIFKSGHLLTAFGISFIPAALCLITIFTGKHISEQSGADPLPGICFLWSGIILVVLVNLVVYRQLLKR